MSHYFTHTQIILGTIVLISDGNALTGLFFEKQKNMPHLDSLQQNDIPLFSLVKQQLAEYLGGTRQQFQIPLTPTTGTAFQQRVWNALAKIPYGSTLSYRQLAEHIGAPKSVRAIAHATGCNPISLIIPCHRIIGSNGKLVGYAGGLERKQMVLDIEKKNSLSHANILYS